MPSPVVNTTNIRNIYPGSGAASTGLRASAGSNFTGRTTVSSSSEMGSSEVAQAVEVGNSQNPFVYWGAMVVVLLTLMWFSQRFGTMDEFKNIKLSAYNILVITLAAMLGFNLLKVVFTKWKVPGVTAVVLAA